MPEYKSVQHLPGAITLARLSNGLTVIVQENHVAPVATVRCYVKNTGGAFEGKWLGAGLSHLVEHLVSGGTTTNRGEKEIEAIIDTFGGATNAYTSSDITAYYIDCPSKNTMTAIELIADAMQNVVFEKDEFEREYKVVQRELEDGEVNRQRVRWKLLQTATWMEHPARTPTIGYLDVLQKITRDDCIQFYQERYVPNNQIFVVVGNVETQKILDEVAKQFKNARRARETLITFPDEPEQLAPRRLVREMDGDSTDLALSWPTIELSHPDLFALDVAAYILTEGKSSRLARKLIFDNPLALSVDSASYTPHYVRGMFAVFASCQPDKTGAVEKVILDEVERLKQELVSPDELAKAKKQKAAELVFDRQRVQDAAESLSRSYVATGDPLFDQHYVEGIQKVTAKDIQRVAKKYFSPQRQSTILIVPKGSRQAEQEEAVVADESDIEKHVLENGIRVLIKQHAHLPLVNMQAYTMGATLVESEDQAGLSTLVAAMLDKGTQSHSAEEIAEYFDSVGGRLAMSSGRNTIYGSATVLKDDFPQALGIFAECVTKPTFPEDEFEKMKTLALGAIARRAANPQSEIFEVFYDNLPKSTPYHIVQGGKADTVEKLTPMSCAAYHKKYFVPQNMVVAVFGDIDTKSALKMVKQHFGHLKPNPDFEKIDVKDRSNDLKKTIVTHKQTNKPTGMVLMGFPSMNIYNKEEYAAMTLLDAVTSGYSYPGGWLHNELRGQGLVYYVHAFQITGPAPGYFAVLSQTKPETVKEVVQRIQKNLEKAKSGKITAEEFQTAKRMVIALHAQSNTTITSQAQQAALDELYGLGYDYDKSFDDRIEAVTLEQVTGVARKYLNKYLLVTSSPEEKLDLQSGSE